MLSTKVRRSRDAGSTGVRQDDLREPASTRRAVPCHVAAAACLIAATTGAQCSSLLLPIQPGADAAVHVLHRLANGDVLVAGAFTTLQGIAVNHIARWSGGSVTPLGAGTDGTIYAVLELGNGDVVVAGSFANAGGAPAAAVARWDGASWSPLGAGIAGNVFALAQRANGDLFAGGDATDRVQRWDGTAWHGTGLPPSPLPGLGLAVRALHVLPNGDLLAGGQAVFVGGATIFAAATWDGATWTGTPGVSGTVDRFRTLANGDLLACGSMTGLGIARWLGGSWAPAYGSGVPIGGVLDVVEAPDGDLFAGGTFFYIGPSITARYLARLRAGAWEAVVPGFVGFAYDLLPLPGDAVLVGGSFVAVGGQPAGNLALLTTTCPATATPVGTGCSGSAGPVALSPSALPWIGATARSLATGVPANAFVVGVLGTQPLSLPLAAVLPQGAPGCTLLARPDALTLHPAAAGSAELGFALPPSTALVGQVLHQQAAVVELAGSGAIATVTSSNALTLTIGAF